MRTDRAEAQVDSLNSQDATASNTYADRAERGFGY